MRGLNIRLNVNRMLPWNESGFVSTISWERPYLELVFVLIVDLSITSLLSLTWLPCGLCGVFIISLESLAGRIRLFCLSSSKSFGSSVIVALFGLFYLWFFWLEDINVPSSECSKTGSSSLSRNGFSFVYEIDLFLKSLLSFYPRRTSKDVAGSVCMDSSP